MSVEMGNNQDQIILDPVGVVDDRYILEKKIGTGGFSV